MRVEHFVRGLFGHVSPFNFMVVQREIYTHYVEFFKNYYSAYVNNCTGVSLHTISIKRLHQVRPYEIYVHTYIATYKTQRLNFVRSRIFNGLNNVNKIKIKIKYNKLFIQCFYEINYISKYIM